MVCTSLITQHKRESTQKLCLQLTSKISTDFYDSSAKEKAFAKGTKGDPGLNSGEHRIRMDLRLNRETRFNLSYRGHLYNII